MPQIVLSEWLIGYVLTPTHVGYQYEYIEEHQLYFSCQSWWHTKVIGFNLVSLQLVEQKHIDILILKMRNDLMLGVRALADYDTWAAYNLLGNKEFQTVIDWLDPDFPVGHKTDDIEKALRFYACGIAFLETAWRNFGQ